MAKWELTVFSFALSEALLKRSAPRTECSSSGAIDVERSAPFTVGDFSEGVILNSVF